MAELRDVLATALRAGQLMLEAGAATARVEEVVHRLGTALGAQWMDIYVTPTGIIAMATSFGEHRTRVQRVTQLSVNLDRVHAIYALSRRTAEENLSLDDVRANLETIAKKPRRYSRLVTSVGVGIGCACFAVIFGAGPREFVATFAAATLAQVLRLLMAKLNLSLVISTAILATAAGFLGAGFATLLAAQTSQVLIASMLLLVPGVFLVGAISDLIAGNLVSGLARGAYASLLIGAIGAGLWIVLFVLGKNLP